MKNNCSISHEPTRPTVAELLLLLLLHVVIIKIAIAYSLKTESDNLQLGAFFP